MKKMFIINLLGVALAVTSAVIAGPTTGDNVTREVKQVRIEAVNALSRNLPCKFITEQTLLDALNFINDKLDPKTHQELLKLQAQADDLNNQRLMMLAIPGIDVDHPAVKYIDAELVLVEKRLDDLLYNGGFFNWKTMLGLGAGLVVGTAVNVGVMPFIEQPKGAVISITTGFAVAVLLEWMLRGRRAVLGGNFATLAKFIAGVAAKFFRAVFGDGGYFDRMVASVERALRSIGKKLDKVMDNRWVTAGIGAASAVTVGLLIWMATKAVTKATNKPADAPAKAPAQAAAPAQAQAAANA